MGVRKFRSIEQMPARPNRTRLDPENLRLALGLSSLAGGLNSVRLIPGVGRFRSRDEAVTARARPIPARNGVSLADTHWRLEELVRATIPEGVTYLGRWSAEDIEDGYFRPAPGDVPGPEIVIYRDHMDVPGDLVHEVLTLAHELGHLRSFEAGLRTIEYESAILVPWTKWPGLTRTARAAILDEERRAWLFAREILAETGFSEWDAFWHRHREALSDYRQRLGIDRDPPPDVEHSDRP